jgi:NPCBM/NEW2 domain
MSAIRILAFVLVLSLAPTFALGSDDGPRSTAAGVPSDPVFTALLIDGTTVSGQIRRLGEKEGLTLVSEQGEERQVAFDRLVKLTREAASPPTNVEGGEIVLFPDGDRITRCKIGRTSEFNIAVHSFALEDLSVPLDSVLGLILNTPSDSASVDALITRVRTEPRESELAWLANGDKLPGLLAGLDEKKLIFQASTGKLDLPRTDSGVLALGFAQAQVSYRRPAGPYLELTLLDGSRLGVTKIRVERGQVVGTTRFNTEVRLPIGELALVHAMNGPVAYLSDRETSGAIYEPYIGPTRNYRRNATVAGEVLRVGGNAYDRGLGTQSRTLLVYKIEPGSKRFQALVGLDDRAGPLGSVVFKVQVVQQADRAIVFDSNVMTSGMPPKPVDIDLTGAKAVVLITEFGERGDVQDLADWIEARIIR